MLGVFSYLFAISVLGFFGQGVGCMVERVPTFISSMNLRISLPPISLKFYEIKSFVWLKLFYQFRYLVELGCIKPLCDLLTVMDSKIVQVALNGLENILRLGEQEAKRNGSGINPYCALIEEAYGKRD